MEMENYKTDCRGDISKTAYCLRNSVYHVYIYISVVLIVFLQKVLDLHENIYKYKILKCNNTCKNTYDASWHILK